METPNTTGLSRGRGALLAASAAAPLVAWLVLQKLGFIGLARLAGLGAAGIVVGIVCFTLPRYGVYFLVFYIYAGLSFYLPGVAIIAIVLSITVAMLLGFARGEVSQLRDPVFAWAAGIFALVGAGSMLFARNEMAVVSALIQFLKAVLAATLIVQAVRTPDQLRWLARWIFIGATATVFLGTINLMLGLDTSVNIIGEAKVVRFSGAHANPNYAAFFMTSAIPIGVFLVRYGAGKFDRLLGVVGAVTLIVGVTATFSRTALVGLSAVIVGVLVREVRDRRAYAAIIVLFAAGILLTPRYYWMRIWALTEIASNVGEDYSVYLRFEAMKRSWQMFLENPLTGVGLHNFRFRSEMFKPVTNHNMYLNTASGAGVFGIAALLAIYFNALRGFYRGSVARWPESYSWMKHLAFYFGLALFSTMLDGFFADIEYNYMLWVPIGVSLVFVSLRARYALPDSDAGQSSTR